MQLRRAGGKSFKAAALAYKARCAGHGRGYQSPAFHWVRYYFSVIYGSRVDKGTTSAWLTRPAFIRWQVDREGQDQGAAELEWERQMQVLPESR